MMKGISDSLSQLLLPSQTKLKKKIHFCAQGTISQRACTPFKIALIILLLYMYTISAENFSLIVQYF